MMVAWLAGVAFSVTVRVDCGRRVLVRCHNTAICDPLCVETLQNLTSVGGCCINNLFNGESSRNSCYKVQLVRLSVLVK